LRKVALSVNVGNCSLHSGGSPFFLPNIDSRFHPSATPCFPSFFCYVAAPFVCKSFFCERVVELLAAYLTRYQIRFFLGRSCAPSVSPLSSEARIFLFFTIETRTYYFPPATTFSCLMEVFSPASLFCFSPTSAHYEPATFFRCPPDFSLFVLLRLTLVSRDPEGMLNTLFCFLGQFLPCPKWRSFLFPCQRRAHSLKITSLLLFQHTCTFARYFFVPFMVTHH